jgi:hypothetical protein
VVCIHVAQGRACRRAVNEDRGPNEPSCSEKAGGGRGGWIIDWASSYCLLMIDCIA